MIFRRARIAVLKRYDGLSPARRKRLTGRTWEAMKTIAGGMAMIREIWRASPEGMKPESAWHKEFRPREAAFEITFGWLREHLRMSVERALTYAAVAGAENGTPLPDSRASVFATYPALLGDDTWRAQRRRALDWIAAQNEGLIAAFDLSGDRNGPLPPSRTQRELLASLLEPFPELSGGGVPDPGDPVGELDELITKADQPRLYIIEAHTGAGRRRRILERLAHGHKLDGVHYEPGSLTGLQLLLHGGQGNGHRRLELAGKAVGIDVDGPDLPRILDLLRALELPAVFFSEKPLDPARRLALAHHYTGRREKCDQPHARDFPLISHTDHQSHEKPLRQYPPTEDDLR